VYQMYSISVSDVPVYQVYQVYQCSKFIIVSDVHTSVSGVSLYQMYHVSGYQCNKCTSVSDAPVYQAYQCTNVLGQYVDW